MPLDFQNDNVKTIKVSQFVKTTTEYTTKENKKKTSNKVEPVEYQLSYHQIYQKLAAMRSDYIKHKYQIYNDKYHWPIILSTTEKYEEIYHMDFLENLSQHVKYEPQSSHFNKSQYSLHCTVQHTSNDEAKYDYLYHLSHMMKHAHTFTSAIVDHILDVKGIPSIICFKSDNCSTQYKCKWVFRFWHSLAQKTSTKVIIYFEVFGHGKGLVWCYVCVWG